MGFGEAVRTCFNKFITFQGRAIRSEYWYFVLFAILASIVAAILDAIVTPNLRRGPFSALLSLLLFLPSLSVSVRRLHDINRSGWWIGGLYIYAAFVIAVVLILAGGSVAAASGSMSFLVVLLLAGFVAYAVLLLVFALLKGTDGPNRYGADPLQSATSAG